MSVSPLHAQTKNFYEGKTITFLVGSSAGGGTDLTARVIARHIERYIPGKPRIDVANKPGAGGMIAANELYNLKKPDGLSISTLNTGSLFATATGNEAIKFDLQKFLWVGQAFDDAQVLYLKTSTPYTSFDAIRKANKEGKQPKMGAQALDHTSNVVVKIAEQIFGLDFQVIPGYPGTPQILLDIERGALDGRAQGIGSLMATRREWIKNGYIKILATSKKRRDPRVPDIAHDGRTGAGGEQRFAASAVCRAKSRALRCFAAGRAGGSGENPARRFCRDDQRRTFSKGIGKVGSGSRFDPRRRHEPRHRSDAAR